ncbi:MAG: PilZ domain-containing protein [Elusimicrobiota bacterium]|nr:MAG: PilZ domain-containing protein [Elusimicrobiota bacterium]
MTQKSGSEQRRHPRTAVGATFDISMAGPSAAKCRATITDLSAGGMTFKTDAELEKGMTLHLRVADIHVRGEVRSVLGAAGGQRRYGVRFHKVGLDSSRIN